MITLSRCDANRQRGRCAARGRAGGGLLLPPILLLIALMLAAVAYIVYVLWPRWPGAPVALDAPALPITVARRRLQRAAGGDPRAGAAAAGRARARRSRLHVALARAARRGAKAGRARGPPAAGATLTLERIFVTIARRRRRAGAGRARAHHLSALCRRRAGVRPDRSRGARVPRRHALSGRGSDLRCGRRRRTSWCAARRNGAGPTPGTCLYERRIEDAPTSWCASRATGSTDWQHRSPASIDRLIARSAAGRT